MMNYGIIGNCKSCALVSKTAAIEWFCFPDFGSASVFAKILDEKQGGSFEVIPKGDYTTRQEYLPHTNILQTFFESGNSSFVVIDFFPRTKRIPPNNRILRQNRLIRIIRPLKGKPIIRVVYNPKLDYANAKQKISVWKKNLITRNGKQKLSLSSNVDYDMLLHDSYFKLDHTKYFVVGEEADYSDYNVTKCLKLMNSTKQYWKRWVSSLVLPKHNRELIIRSALVLKLLTFSETGAIIAASTTSIPEEVGSVRTWDYRFCWVRDASFTVDALKKIGRDYEAKSLMEFIFDQTIKKNKPMQIMYGIHGETRLTENTLDHLAGFKGSKPVRIGNAAYSEKQNDIYGSLIDILYLYYVYYEYEKKLPSKYWTFLKYLVSEINHNWMKKDSGIWEFRGIHKHFTYSKLMCYIGMDRAVKIAQHYSQHKLAEKWIFLRDEIRNDILKNAWNESKRTFTMSYDSKELDASVLMMSYHNFLENDDPRLINTVKTIYNNLRDDALVRRYKMNDDFGKSSSSFTICSFWLIDALYNIGEVEKARGLFNKMLKYANHLGLFSEDVNIKSGELIGNFPQAYTHIALINTSILLSEWSTKRKKIVPNGNRLRQ